MHTRTSRTLTALAATAMLAVASGPAHASTPTDPPVVIPTGATTLAANGSGWGHGHGMSQWGAQGAALLGKTAAEILRFYYPGTQLSGAAGKIRVLITADSDNNLKVAPAAGLRVRDLGNGRNYKLKKKAKAWRLKSVGGQTRVYYKTGHWHLYKTGGRRALAGSGEFRSSTHQLTLKLPTGSRIYRGSLRFTGGVTVNVVQLDKYVRGVVPSEVYTTWQPAALQAQAVAARTYAARERADSGGRNYDLCDTSHCQVYRGISDEVDSTNQAVMATSGQILTYQGAPAFAQFASSSGGWTSTGNEPYLIAQPDIYDTTSSGDPHLGWTVPVSVLAIQNARPTIGTLTSIQITDRDGDSLHPNEGWVQSIALTGTTGTATMTGDEFHDLFGLGSAYFTLSAS